MAVSSTVSIDDLRIILSELCRILITLIESYLKLLDRYGEKLRTLTDVERFIEFIRGVKDDAKLGRLMRAYFELANAILKIQNIAKMSRQELQELCNTLKSVLSLLETS